LIERAAIAGRPVRLIGVAVGDLVDAGDAKQLVFGQERQAAAAEAVDEVRERFGSDAVIPARIAPRPVAAPRRPRSDR
jgi:hypothetical protein